MARWKKQGPVTIFTPLNSTRNKGEELCTPTYKLALLKLVETEESFSKDIMRDLHMKK